MTILSMLLLSLQVNQNTLPATHELLANDWLKGCCTLVSFKQFSSSFSRRGKEKVAVATIPLPVVSLTEDWSFGTMIRSCR